MNGMFGIAEFLANVGEGLRILIVPIDIAQLGKELRKARRVQAAVFLDAVLRALLELFEVPPGLGNANYRAGKFSSPGQLLQGGKDLFVSEVAGGTKKHQRIRIRRSTELVSAMCLL